MVGWWPGDGNANDIVGGNNGTLVGGVSFVPGEVGQAFSFDGTTGYVQIPSSPALQPLTAISIDAWVYPTAFSTTPPNSSAVIISKYDSANGSGFSWDLSVQPTGQVEWYLIENPSTQLEVVTVGALSLGKWQHVAAIFDTATQGIAVYVNGVQFPTTCGIGAICGTVTSIYQSSANVLIGALISGNPGAVPSNLWSGLIDEVEVFNRVLSQSEIQALYNAGSAGKCKACQVNVTRLNQCQGKPGHWGGETYDSKTDGTTMCGAGCATTSLSVALFNQLITVLPLLDQQGHLLPNDPGYLNTFMTLNHDYAGTTGAAVNWYSTVHDVGGPSLHFNANYDGSDSADDLSTILCQYKQPVVVGVNHCDGSPCLHFPCHFVLVTGQSGNDFTIADPCGNPKTNLSDYDTFEIRGIVQDPAANNSELVLSVGDAADLMLIDPNGLRTGFDASSGKIVKEIPGSYYARDSLDNDETDAPVESVTHFAGVFQPVVGTYRLILSGVSLGTFTMSMRTYSLDGSGQPAVAVQGIAGGNSSTTLQLQVTSTPGGGSSIVLISTFESTLADINNSLQLDLIDNQGIANSLSQKIQAAQTASGAARNNILNAFKNEVSAQSGKHITGIAVQVLLLDANSLIGQNP
jgi:hypothetical protein